MRESSCASARFPSSSSSSSSSWVLVSVVLVPLLVVSFVVLVNIGVDNSSASSWYSPSSSSSSSSSSYMSSSSIGGDQEEEQEEEFHHLAVVVAENNGSNLLPPPPPAAAAAALVSQSPSAAPTAAPEPSGYFEGSEAKGAISTPKRARRRDIKLDRLEFGLSRARAAIREAVRNPSAKSLIEDKDYVPQGPIYRNAHAFHRSYLEMEKLFRVYVYDEGEPPLFHDGPCKSIYSMEGRFIYTMEMGNKLRTRDPDRAHVFFLPFSVVKMVKFLYQPNTFDIGPLKRTIADYINVVGGKYPYWNRSLGADHFMLSCHDWGPHASAATSYLRSNSIRVLCNANASEGFNPSKDVSLPEINLQTGVVMAGIIGGPSASHRPILAFFAGGLHGHIRSLLLKQWQGKDEEIQVHQYLPKGVSYYDTMRKSRYCLCPSGYEVASPRIVEAIYLECVPVVISDSYVLPFSDVLDWKSFSVQVEPKDIPRLKTILNGISSRQYIRMQRRVKMVQKHFVVSSQPARYDVFHMILHSIWLRRLNVRIELHDQ